MKKLLMILIGLLASDAAFACMCGPLPFEEEVRVSSHIFHGRVLAVNDYLFDIEIIQAWKGEFATTIFQLKQGQTSCERRMFDLNKEYLFYVKGKAVFNCSRTEEYQFTIDSELLDLKFNNLGDKEAIESNSFTDRELLVLKALLESKNISSEGIVGKHILFAIEEKFVDKWAFFEGCMECYSQIRLTTLIDTDPASTVIWKGTNWKKSFRKLKKRDAPYSVILKQ
jgi:hypothetical protein